MYVLPGRSQISLRTLSLTLFPRAHRIFADDEQAQSAASLKFLQLAAEWKRKQALLEQEKEREAEAEASEGVEPVAVQAQEDEDDEE